MPRRLVARLAAAVALALAFSGGSTWFVAPAGAHSALEESSPASGEVLDASPAKITLRFNEPVSLPDDAVRLLDTEGSEIDIGDAGALDELVSVDVPTELADGSYVVAWKVMSEDSHPVSGAFTFAVGAPSESASGQSAEEIAAQSEPDTTAPQIAVDVATGLAYAGVLAALGAAWFLVSAAHAEDRARVAAIRRWIQLATGVGAGALVAGVLAENWLIDEITAGIVAQALLGWAGLSLVETVVRWGDGVSLRLQRGLVGAATALSTVAFVLVGHTRTATPLALTIAADLAHLAAAAVWTGGLVALLLFLRSGTADTDARVVSRFSGWATVSIVVVVAAGGVLGWRIVGSWEALTGTTYGVLLLVKVGLFAVVAALGAYNRFRLVGREVAGHSTLRRTLAVEAAVVVVIIAITGVLTSTSPNDTEGDGSSSGWSTGVISCQEAADMAGMPGMEDMNHAECVGTTVTTSSLVPFDPTASAGQGGAISEAAAFGDGTALVTVSPGRVGTNTVYISLTDADGKPIDVEQLPTVEFRLREQELGPISATPERVGTGAFRLTQDFVLAGEWEINVSAVVSDFEQPQAIVKVPIG